MANMFVVVNTKPGDSMSRLMTFLSENAMEFSVTSNLASLVDAHVNAPIDLPSSKYVEQPTESDFHVEPPLIVPEDPSKGLRESSMRNVAVKNEMSFRQEEESMGRDYEEGEEYMDMPYAAIETMYGNPTLEYDAPSTSARNRRNQELEDEEEEELPVEKNKWNLQQSFDHLQTPVNPSPSRPTTSRPSAVASTSAKKRRIPGKEDGRRRPRGNLSHIRSTGINGPVECTKCDLVVKSHRRISHVTTHLHMKIFKCVVCETMISRLDRGRPHYELHHPKKQFTPLVQEITPEQRKQIDEMMRECFPGCSVTG